MNPFFKNINIFLARKIHFFKEKFRKIKHILQKFPNFFEKLFWKFQLFHFYGGPYKSREISDEFCYLPERFVKKLKMTEIEKDYWKWDENSRKYWRKSILLCRKIQDTQDMTNNSHQPGKIIFKISIILE